MTNINQIIENYRNETHATTWQNPGLGPHLGRPIGDFGPWEVWEIIPERLLMMIGDYVQIRKWAHGGLYVQIHGRLIGDFIQIIIIIIEGKKRV